MPNRLTLLLLTALLTHACATAQLPDHGEPRVSSPLLLEWDLDRPPLDPDLSEPTSNRIYDLHLSLQDCEGIDLILSTAGNYHMALRDFWFGEYLPDHPEVRNWYFTTSPPISPKQVRNGGVSFGNVRLECMPHLAVGPAGLMEQLREQGSIEGEPAVLFRNYGNVLLVRRGNPKGIRSIWDLGRDDVVTATSNPYTEAGSFGNYAHSIYHIALADSTEAAATALYRRALGDSTQWVVGKRIHHREVPHLIATGQADAAPLFYHLARYVTELFPEHFEIVPLGGTVAQPEPLPGNRVATLYIARVDTPLTEEQRRHRERLFALLTGEAFMPYLVKHGLRR